MQKIIGIYKITCLVNNKIYIGSSNNIYKRWNEHIWELNNYKHDNKHLQDAWNKYGKENFIFEVIEECSKDTKLEREQYYMDLYKTYNRDIGFNISRNALAPMEGRKHSEETKQHFSEIRKGKNIGKNNPMYGKRLSKETKQKISKASKGKNNGFYGKHHTEKTKQKISLANSGRHLTEEEKQHLSDVFSGGKNPTSKCVYMYDDNNNLVNKFDTVNECGIWLLENQYITTTSKNPLPIFRTMIARSIKNNKKYGGFILSYEPITKSA